MSSALGEADHVLLLVLGLWIRLSIVVRVVKAALVITGECFHGLLLLHNAHPLVNIAGVPRKLASLFERAEPLLAQRFR